MKRLAILGIIACVGLLVGSTAVIGAPPGPPEGLSVNVAGPNPLPISGNVNVTNTPNVNVTNAPNVNVTNAPDVNVANQPTVNAYQAGDWSVNIENATKVIKSFTDRFTSSDGWLEVYQVPSGKRFVLTDIYFCQRSSDPDSPNVISLVRSEVTCGGGYTDVMLTHVNPLGPPTAGEVYMGSNQVFFSLQTGYEFFENERICVSASGGGFLFYNLTGYETDI